MRALFGRVAPLEVEVGSGKGLFLQSAAASNPDHNFLGIEIATKYARFAAARVAKHGLNNAVMVHGDAQPIFADLLPDQFAGRGACLLPRSVVEETARETARAERAVRAAGRAHAHCWAARSTIGRTFSNDLRRRSNCLPRKTTLVGPLEVAERPAEHELDYRTHFERRMRLADLPVYRSEFRKG